VAAGKMTRRSIIFAALSLFCVPFCRAQNELDSVLSLDLSYAITGLLNQGWGIGLSYEKKFADYVSAKGTLGHMTFLTNDKDRYCTSVSVSLFFNYYPLGGALDKLYIAAGSSADFMNYFGSGVESPSENDVLISIIPKAGWKFSPFRFLLFDVFVGYKFIITGAQNYAEIKNYVNEGIQFGVGTKIFLNKLRKKQGE
jgi:hypothetical protein